MRFTSSAMPSGKISPQRLRAWERTDERSQSAHYTPPGMEKTISADVVQLENL
jgi:hypothetical protein